MPFTAAWLQEEVVWKDGDPEEVAGAAVDTCNVCDVWYMILEMEDDGRTATVEALLLEALVLEALVLDALVLEATV